MRKIYEAGAILNGTHNIGAMTNFYFPLQEKKILCIGLSESEIEQQVAVFGPSEITSLTLWPSHIDAKTEKFKLVIGDITKRTQFDDDQFDAIITLSLLEHVNPLGSALREMKRITKPLGAIASLFGPVWSSAYGHHLYILDPSDPMLNFSLWKTPAYMHLLWSPDEIRSHYLARGYDATTSTKVVDAIFSWEGLNRLMIREYVDSFHHYFHVDCIEYMYNLVPENLINKLRYMFPGHIDFQIYGAKAILRNNLKG